MEIKAGNRKLLLPYDDDLSYWSQVKHRTAAFLFVVDAGTQEGRSAIAPIISNALTAGIFIAGIQGKRMWNIASKTSCSLILKL